MKCITPHYLGHFSKYKGPELRRRGINRIGNLLVPNDNYCGFEDFMGPLLNTMMDEQEESRAAQGWLQSNMAGRTAMQYSPRKQDVLQRLKH